MSLELLLLIFIIGTSAVFLSILMPKSIKSLFAHKEILIVTAIFTFTDALCRFLSFYSIGEPKSRLFLPSGIFLNEFDNVLSFFIVLLMQAFFAGWLTRLISQTVLNGKAELGVGLQSIGRWLPRSIFVQAIGWVGSVAISFAVLQIENLTIAASLMISLLGLYTSLTFTLYPTFILSRKPIFRSLADSFAINIKSARVWFPNLLLLLLVSGGVTYVWIPEGFFGNVREILGWGVHVQWVGGYSFVSYWYVDAMKFATGTNPSTILYTIVFMVNVIVATAIRTKVIKSLHEKGYLNCFDEEDLKRSNNETTKRGLIDEAKPYITTPFNVESQHKQHEPIRR